MQLLVGTWSDGVYVFGDADASHELPGCAVSDVISVGSEAWAVIDQSRLLRRSPDARWEELARAEHALATCLVSGNATYVGTDDHARLMVLREGRLEFSPSFDEVEGRDGWYAGTALVGGRTVGPPLGIRSMSAADDGSVLFANVHVGGICRSVDGGVSWQQTIDIEADVHEVAVHPEQTNVVAAAAATGLHLSSDGAASWSVETDGMHEPHCLAVAFLGEDVLIAASEHPFAEKGAVYRKRLGSEGPLELLGGGFPRWTDGVVDTSCIGVSGSNVAIVDRSGQIFVSKDGGSSWERLSQQVVMASALAWV